MATRLSRPVYVIGVGMHPFNNQRLSSESMADVAGMAALGDAGIAFAEVGALYNGYLGGGVTSGVAIAKEFGLTGIPVTHVENASATGSCAFGEAVHAVGGGRVDVAMALGFDDMNRMSGLGRGTRGRVGAEDIMLPAAFFAIKTAVFALLLIAFSYLLASYKGLPNVLVVMALLIGLYTFLTNRSTVGRRIYALGGNEKAALHHKLLGATRAGGAERGRRISRYRQAAASSLSAQGSTA